MFEVLITVRTAEKINVIVYIFGLLADDPSTSVDWVIVPLRCIELRFVPFYCVQVKQRQLQRK